MKFFHKIIVTSFFFSLPSAPGFAATSDSVRSAVGPASYNLLRSEDRRHYAEIFAAIKAERWADAQKLIDKAGDKPLAHMAQAELYLAANSPRVEASALAALLNKAPYLPQAERLESLAIKRGAVNLPERPAAQRLSYLGSAPKRDLPDGAADAANLRNDINEFIRKDDPASAESLVESKAEELSAAGLTELRYRVAWSYYIENQDENAVRISDKAKSAGGDWGAQAHWVNALAHWRLKNYRAALDAFDHVAQFGGNDDLRAAGLFWSARAAIAAKIPQKAQAFLQSAARLPETFYGLLAAEALGMDAVPGRQARNGKLDWERLKQSENIQIAVGLSEIGQTGLAEEALRFQARIGEGAQHSDLAKLAGSLNLPAAQLWMAHYGPAGGNFDALARYPTPGWTPTGGWRIDPSLAFAHALQESQFRTSAVSQAGARGVMQVRPGTARDLARARSKEFSAEDLDNPAINLEYGQSYMEQLRDMAATEGLLPKVIAAYNAGPVPIARWKEEIRDNGDPLLFIESIPYWETRGYVTIILRNYWIYEMQSGKNGGSITGLAQYLWPTFPGQDGRSTALRKAGQSPLVGRSDGGSLAGVSSLAHR